ncbi:hypothetical protein MRS76_13580 [Rhizobiaceae bacterium n13]|uniref:Uncharacterized protein n=1 Tax=Ferirhizobium litorale TaxID=2927786 RepID=A0AAE3QE33_9HYPH|nr:hypothetical protein [Fererhizobium litorale]MDI7862989.1 hypothetical protein [Fererhizobium litorale]MDI7924062.1 hypothetical protein [Fererhizobium litorale]
MGIEPIGMFTVLLGLYCLALGPDASIRVFVPLALLGAAAAFVLGSASVQPAHLFLMFVALTVFRGKGGMGPALRTLQFGSPGFWLACLVVYGALTAYFAPRLFADATAIIPLGVSEHPMSGGGVPLGPVSSNLTQTVYLVADLLCFMMIVTVGSTPGGFRAIVAGLLAYAFFNIVFALLDLVTSAVGAQDMLQFMRNAQYTFHDNETVNGMKRIVGSWPEASAFAGTTLGAFGFTATMWLCRRASRWTGPLGLLSLIFIILSTSSTGLVAAPICLVILYATAVMRSGVGADCSHSSMTVVFVPLLVTVSALVIVLHEEIYNTVHNYVDLLILSKATSSSAIERGSWNTYGLQNFIDTFGFGAGLGTARTSSFPVALLSNVGVPGTLFFLLFAVTALGSTNAAARTFVSDVRLSARNGCLCLLVGSFVAGPTVDLGLLFFVLAGLAASRPADEDVADADAPFLALRRDRDARRGPGDAQEAVLAQEGKLPLWAKAMLRM